VPSAQLTERPEAFSAKPDIVPISTKMNCQAGHKTRILVVISTWGTKNDRYLLRLVEEYRSMSFHVDIVVLSNLSREIAPGVQVVAVQPRRKWSPLRISGALRRPWLVPQEYREWKRHLEFPFAHKRILAERVNDYDLFIYSEDDVLITEKNLRAFLRVSAVLPENEIPGFLRFEQGADGSLNYPEVHGIFHWDPRTVRSHSEYTLAFFTCEHAACYVLTREQLRRAISSGGFLVKPHSEKYDLLCTAATDPYTQCGFKKLVCISHLDDFLIHHLPNKYVGTSFGVDDHELRRQVNVLLGIGKNGRRQGTLLETETKLNYGIYSKSYYEPVRPEILSAIPVGTRTVLSIGCGWGAIEACLAEKGVRVTAVPLDFVIPGGAQAKGVELIAGDLDEARDALTGREFECLLLSNVLHLVPNPVKVLSSFGALITPGGKCVVFAPNTKQIGANWKTTRGREPAARLGKYEETGVHSCSHKTLQGWFRESGMQVETFTHLGGARARRFRRLALGLTDAWLASEFIATARKDEISPAIITESAVKSLKLCV
jgi:2-polyprenyl-3-methyl-5-hydroxy-6-metoxy-1,4-benzoquinol methylase